ncbi:MAG: Dabb family protein [Oscillospiraceae bacterium]|jgi:DNA-binding FrmR family transcriptional regulator|nr:Dabb family protein [Oscillospiraceae bacterium]
MTVIRHIVFFWLKDKSPANLQDTAERLRGMRGKIEGLVDLEVGVDFLHSERSCDIVLSTLFADRAALDAYRTHPVHLPVQAHMHAVRQSSAAADYEVKAKESLGRSV